MRNLLIPLALLFLPGCQTVPGKMASSFFQGFVDLFTESAGEALTEGAYNATGESDRAKFHRQSGVDTPPSRPGDP